MAKDHEITVLLNRWHSGEKDALDSLVPLVYDDLRILAKNHVSKRQRGTLSSLDVLHEGIVKLIQSKTSREFAYREQFFRLFKTILYSVFADYYRRRGPKREKEENVEEELLLSIASETYEESIHRKVCIRETLAFVYEALEKLRQEDNEAYDAFVHRHILPEKATIPEIAEHLNMKERTLKRRIRSAAEYIGKYVESKIS